MMKVPVNIPGFTPNLMCGAGRVQDTENKGDFGKILENQKKAEEIPERSQDESVDSNEDISQDVKKADDTDVSQTENAENTENTSQVKDVNQTEKQSTSEEETPGQDLTEEVILQILPMLQTAAVDVKELLAQELGISQEELTTLLQDMGISEVDLLNPDAMKEVFLKVNGLDDMAALLTDEELYVKLQNLESGFGEIMETIRETLDISEDEMTFLKEQIAMQNQVQNVEVEQNELPKVELMEEKPSAGQEEGMNQTFATPGQNTFAVQNALEQPSAVPQHMSSYMNAETQNIMNQIMDYMKIQLNAENSALEMQLQPESLGTLQIRITAKEGIMTAQFTTASETVKAALESQMVQLQQQLEDQNIKVDAIEVTVQTHQFESALEQGEERQQTSEEKKNRTRRIDLNNLEDMDDISQEDRIVAEMMAESGSTVDYLA